MLSIVRLGRVNATGCVLLAVLQGKVELDVERARRVPQPHSLWLQSIHTRGDFGAVIHFAAERRKAASWPSDQDMEAGAIIKAADEALYNANAPGRNKVSALSTT
ncbi:hypothetical protein [Burkholderia lata]|uniref:hypothetical protein n=1 Tax=Burkholderia lata (strain ATCC 17760 / DSM 23089 / LMG 22485 / NCIMB 9086 / R18194 / 383) TaxID=482957 RepID=UPI001584144F|nr:hypothetical protein [Burkholderia lata]